MLSTPYSRYFSIVLLLFLITDVVHAAEVKLTSKIEKVTVFLSGAQVHREVPLNLRKGVHELVIEGLPQQLDPNSIQVGGKGAFTILSVNHTLDYIDVERNAKRYQEMKDSLALIQEEIQGIRLELSIIKDEEALLMKNQQLGSENESVSAASLQQMATFMRNRLKEIRYQRLKLKRTQNQLSLQGNVLVERMNKIGPEKKKLSSIVKLKVDCASPVLGMMFISYLVADAAWSPVFDFRVREIDQPVVLDYKANIFQNTGEDWKAVKLILSTGNPKISGALPELKKWNLHYGSIRPFPARRPEISYQEPKLNKDGLGTLMGKVSNAETGELLPFANVVIMKNGNQVGGGQTDFDGKYMIESVRPGTYDLKVSYIGYTATNINGISIIADRITYRNVGMDEGVEVQEVMIITEDPIIELDNNTISTSSRREQIKKMAFRSPADVSRTAGNGVFSRDNGSGGLNVRGSRSGSNPVWVDGIRVQDNYDFGSGNASSVNRTTAREFEIDNPFSIPADGKEYTTIIKKHQLKGDYFYKAIPYVDNNAFLFTRISGWEELDLISGPSNLYYQGTFVGESYLDVGSTADTLEVSLGRDNNIVINREKIKEFSNDQTIGSKKYEQVGWEIKVRNNKSRPIQINVQDQYPVSVNKEIKVAQLDHSGAMVNEKNGIVEWKLEIPPSGSKTINLKYEVQYPKGRRLYLE